MPRLILAAMLCAVGLTSGAAQASERCAILLHGLNRTSMSMLPMKWALEQDGYHVVNVGYRSTSATIETLAQEVTQALASCPGDGPVDVVTHSMGGILLRQHIATHGPGRIRRAVMLGPPNAGSEIVTRLGDYGLFKLLNGPAGVQLGNGSDALPMQLPRHIGVELGVIAGRRSVNPLFSGMIEGEDDGKVSVQSAFAIQAEDRVVLDVSHTFMMMSEQVIAQTRTFLRTGSFDRPG